MSTRASLLLILAAATADSQSRPPVEYVPVLTDTLNKNILAFWYPKTLDQKNGGYTIQVSADNKLMPGGPKGIVTQSRQVWLAARAARAAFGDRAALLAAAEHGYKFLHDKMWDAQNGGFYWETDAAGNATKPNKHLYGNSFGLYAVSEYAMATGRKDVLNFAIEIFNVLDTKAHDREFGGYREYFLRDWAEAPQGEQSYMGGGIPGTKLMNTHLHLLEAVTTFYRASKMAVARERLLELINIQSNAVLRKTLGACTDQYERDWTPRLNAQTSRVSYGHDLENIWLLADAMDAAKASPGPFVDLFKTLFAYAMKYGWDEQRGGFYDSGKFNESADRKSKVWWVEAEALVSALTMYELTKDRQYYDVFEKTWAYLLREQIDWNDGEWFANVQPNGSKTGDKANIWKGGYHNGRAMIESILRVKRLPAPPPSATPITILGK